MVIKQVKKVTNKVIAYAFTIGVIAALVLGLIAGWLPASSVPYLTTILILAGIIVGFFNIGPNETKDYVLYVTALVIVTSFGQAALGSVQVIGPYLESVLKSIMAFVMPSVIIVAIKAVINLARD